MNKKLYIITGAPGKRKSSVIRALTGIFLTKTFQIQFENNPKFTQTHVMISAPKEIKSTFMKPG
jgi:ABC-type transport system involved in cytochrome c biogenesis ATPase subunit